jgi:hypothetical protein
MAAEKKQPTIKEGFVALRGGNCSYDGVEYLADDGVVVVPLEAVKSLIEQGYTGA